MRAALPTALCVFLPLLTPIAAAQNNRPASPARAAAAAPLRVAHAARLTGTIQIDGRLDEPAWQAAEPTGDFVQSWPNPGAPATERTEVRVLYDDQAIYVGIRMFDEHPDSIAAQLARRDAVGIYSDWAHVIFDSYHDRRTSFRFTVNPRGVQKDVYMSNDGTEDVNWDAVWKVATLVDSLGWVAEYRVPLSQLRFGSAPPGQERVWGFQVQREIARRQERDTWSPWNAQDQGFVSRFGDLTGLRDVPVPRRLEVLPYSSVRSTHAPGSAADPFYHSLDTKPKAGLDVRFGLPKGLTLSGTVNPDFGQVEADPAVVNLSAFETFFTEKRPFFIEGSDAFAFGRVLTHNDYGNATYFYSRRIGRAPQRSASGPGVLYVDAPDAATIAAAAKVTGKAGPWSVGLLDAFTPTGHADVAASGGVRYSTPVEPATNYFAGRVRRDFRKGRTVIGAMVTSTARSVGDSVFTGALRSEALFGGVDFEHKFAKQTWAVSGFFAGSRVSGSAAAIAATQQNSTHYYQRPDASYLRFDPARTSLEGHTGEIALERSGAVFGSLAYKELSPGLELNDLGFQGRSDLRALSSLIGYQSFKAGRLFRQYDAFIYENSTWNFGGDAIYHGIATNADVTFRNYWTGGYGVTVNPAYWSDRFTRGGPVARVPSAWTANLNLNSDSRKPVIVGPSASYSHDASGGWNGSLGLGFDTRPTSFIHVTVTPSLSRLRSTGQYVSTEPDPRATATFANRYVFADLAQTTVSMDARVEWTFSPVLSFQLYAQPFVSAGRYRDFKEFAAPRTYDFRVYGRDTGTIAYDDSARVYTVDPDGAGGAPSFSIGNPDFNVRSLRGNAVLRWEYRPGSALFVVWQHQRSDAAPFGNFDFGRDVGAVFRAPATNVFLVKVSYWIGR
jgi:hypothetical protein